MHMDDSKVQILREELISELDDEMRFVGEELGRMQGGLLGAIIGIIAQDLYRLILGEDIRKRAIERIELIIQCSIKLNEPDQDTKQIVDSNFEEYLSYAEEYRIANKGHEEFPQLSQVLRETFKTQVIYVAKLVNGSGNTYAELIRSAFSTREECENAFGEQLGRVERFVQLVEEHPDLINAPPSMRPYVLKILRSSCTYTENMLNQRLDKIYAE